MLMNYIEIVLAAIVFIVAFCIVIPMWRCKHSIVPVKIIAMALWVMADKAWFMVLEYRWVTNHHGNLLPGYEDIQWSLQELNGIAWDLVVIRVLVGFVSYGCHVRGEEK